METFACYIADSGNEILCGADKTMSESSMGCTEQMILGFILALFIIAWLGGGCIHGCIG